MRTLTYRRAIVAAEIGSEEQPIECIRKTQSYFLNENSAFQRYGVLFLQLSDDPSDSYELREDVAKGVYRSWSEAN